MGTEKRPNLAPTRNVPGPGNYIHKTAMGEGPKIALSPRIQERKPQLLVPGPGAYEPNSKAVHEKSPATGLGFGVRGFQGGKNKINVPGPGSYTPPEKVVEGPKYGFGKSQRTIEKNAKVPGPGNYDIGPSFANLPNYEKSKMKK